MEDDHIYGVVNSIGKQTIKYALVFTSPEWLKSKTFEQLLSLRKVQKRLGIIAVDEAHFIDLWGGNFRSAYEEMSFLKELGMPVVALSGSATVRTFKVIKESLKLSDPDVVKTTFSRLNLTLNVIRKTAKPVQQLFRLISYKYSELCGIVYCSQGDTTKILLMSLKLRV